VLLALVLVVGELEPHFVVVFGSQEGVLAETSPGQVIEVHEQIDVQSVNHYKPNLRNAVPVIACLVEKLQTPTVTLVVHRTSQM